VLKINEKIPLRTRYSNLEVEPVRIHEITDKRFTFIADPDGLPIEFCEK
jgi:glyoxylase I family protein